MNEEGREREGERGCKCDRDREREAGDGDAGYYMQDTTGRMRATKQNRRISEGAKYETE